MKQSIILAALSAFSVCIGAPKMPPASNNQKYCHPPQKIEPECQEPKCPLTCDLQGHYEVCNAYNVTLGVSALYWQPREEGLDYVIKNLGATQIDHEGSVKRIPFDWDWGFRLDLGYQVQNRKMNLDLCWTHFVTEGSTDDSTTFPDFLFSVWSVPTTSSTNAFQTQAQAHSHLSYNVLDLGMRTTFSPRKFLDLTPFVDLSTAWIHQEFLIKLSGGPAMNGGSVLEDRIDMHNNYWGIGPKIGLDTLWSLGYGLGICGNFNLSLLYGFFNVKQNETTTFSNLTPSVTYLDIDHNQFHISRLNLDFLIGLRWDKMFCCDQYHLLLEAGWENIILLGQNELMRFPSSYNKAINSADRGDLTIQGLSMRGAFTF